MKEEIKNIEELRQKLSSLLADMERFYKGSHDQFVKGYMRALSNILFMLPPKDLTTDEIKSL